MTSPRHWTRQDNDLEPKGAVKEGVLSTEFESAAAAAVGGFVGKVHGHPTPSAGSNCANCSARLQGPWCHACGQSAEDFHRSILRLLGEVIEGLLHVDSRLWRTLPDLLFRPARLTRSYLEGHRAPQIPPLRLFLVVLLGIFVVGGLTGTSRSGRVHMISTPMAAGGKTVTAQIGTVQSFRDLTPQQRQKLANEVQVSLGSDKPNQAATQWLRDRLERTLADPERFQLILEQWSERFSFLMLPISAIFLSFIFIFQRKFFIFDHTIFSLHSLSAVGMGIILSLGLTPFIDDWAFLPLLAAPVHLFTHMRGVYGTSVIGTLVRMMFLFIGSITAAILLMLGLIAVGLAGMGG